MDLSDFLSSYFYINNGFYINPFFSGILLQIFLIFLIFLILKKFPKSSFSILFDLIYEYAYKFFEDILSIGEKKWIKIYITTMFFVILFSNVLGVFLEIIGVGFPEMHHYIKIPTSDINFNVAMAIIGVFIVIYEQFKFLGFGKTLYEYFPIFGKGYIPYEKGSIKNKFFDRIVFILVKFFDILISLFLGILDIVGHLAKIISLSFRLFGNMISGSLLLVMLVAGSIALSSIIGDFIGIKNFDFPFLFPVILHLQGILVALIQALVFPLLIAIFIKVAKVE